MADDLISFGVETDENNRLVSSSWSWNSVESLLLVDVAGEEEEAAAAVAGGGVDVGVGVGVGVGGGVGGVDVDVGVGVGGGGSGCLATFSAFPAFSGGTAVTEGAAELRRRRLRITFGRTLRLAMMNDR